MPPAFYRWPFLVLSFSIVGSVRADFQVVPEAIHLEGAFARAQVVVGERQADGSVSDRSADLTAQAIFASSNPGVATVSAAGQVLAVNNGEAVVTVTVGGLARKVPVRVGGVTANPALRFEDRVLPILSKAGCNAGACHASQYGKGGLKLSVFASAPSADWEGLVRDRFNRRVNFLTPDQSLFLLKATATIPHGGGKRIDVESLDYRVLRQWIVSGAQRPDGASPHVSAIQVHPARRVGAPGFTQQLRVTAIYSDHTTRDVTSLAKYDSTEEGVVQVSKSGLVRGSARGQGAVMIRYEGQAEICTVVVPGGTVADLRDWKENNFIDKFAAAKFREIGISPSPLCDDATFLRRAFLDAIGTLPTPEQAAAFIDSKVPDKRAKLIGRLLGLTGDASLDIHNNAYAAWWALKWADLLRNSSNSGNDDDRMWSLYNWLSASFRDNKPFDRFVRELITARGSNIRNGPANFFITFGNPQARTEAVAQLFMGVRLQCAQCHHHPFETISQADYHAFSAFFVRVSYKGTSDYGAQYNPMTVLDSSGGEATHPRTGQVLKPKPLYGEPLENVTDRRKALADWITGPSGRRFFARNIVNRYMGYLFGRGPIEPIDDIRQTNPATNPELLDALADNFIANGFNGKKLLRTIMSSRLYQLDARPTAANATDRLFYSHYCVKRIAAEPLLDAIDQATGSPTKFAKVPLGTRAIELPDGEYENDFLKTFGKPKREQTCECERVSEPNLSQALHTLNGDIIAVKLANPKGRVAKLLEKKKPHDEIVTELYLATLSRRPDVNELSTARQLLPEAPGPATFYQDLLWSLINSKQFLFVH